MENLLPQVRAILSTTADRWLSLVETIPGELLARTPAPGEWSALDCLRHLLDTERFVFPVRVRTFLAGQESFPAFDSDTQGTNDPDATPVHLATEFARNRLENLQLLEQVTPADFARTATHGRLGPVTLGEMLHEWAAHDLMHTVQAERALMQPFIAGCGPWRGSFADHEVASA